MVEVKDRPYQGAEDDRLVRELLSRSFAVGGHPYFSVDPPNWERFRAAASEGSSRQAACLWVEEATGCLVGLGLYQREHCTFSYLVDPQRGDIADRVVAWAEDRHLTADFLRLLYGSPIYRPELDLVITGSDGSVAAFCTMWFDAQHKVGFVEPVGTVDAYRRLGLGKVVMLKNIRLSISAISWREILGN